MPRRRPSVPAAVRRRRAALAVVALLALIAGVLAGARADRGDQLDFRPAVASTFSTVGEPLACGGTLQAGQAGAASPTLPCGTRVVFRLQGRTATAPVIDRGPYVGGRDFDLTPATADALRFDGLGTIEWALARGK